ncbi:MAG: NAD(P)-dependent oxidoreductase [Ectothiorhodospiraceae bacterium]|nr:NAD(P)-dependent oxidoreductase [Ectothiorhodospiraceae bacterium]
MSSILILGATGYIGGKLVGPLLQSGHDVHCLIRRPESRDRFPDAVTCHIGDALEPDSLTESFAGRDIVFYLIHSMSDGEDFEQKELATAGNVRQAAEHAGVKRIIYLGGLGDPDLSESKHLRSRRIVGEVLRAGRIPVTEFRAAVIVGSGSASFEMVHHLVNRLPLMICPKWLVVNTQPIAISDVLRYLAESVENEESSGKTLDIGGPEVLSYRAMMLTVAKVLYLKRVLIQVPVLTPRLSSYWVMLVTPLRASLAKILIDSVKNETVCRSDTARTIFPFTPIPYEEAVRRSLHAVLKDNPLHAEYIESGLESDHLITNEQVLEVSAPAQRVYDVVSSIGGKNGWYYATWLWKIRGWMDQLLGGVGMRRGRRHPTDLQEGEPLDFWRVEMVDAGRSIRLRAEMRVWGKAWLQFTVEPQGDNATTLSQTAYYYPKGVTGLLYWYAVYPLHWFVFRGMVKAIGKQAERSQ